MSTVHDSSFDRIPNDLYPTPKWCTRVLADYIRHIAPPCPDAITVYEPASGGNKMADTLANSYPVLVSDIEGAKFSMHHNVEPFNGDDSPIDFLNIKNIPSAVTHIVTNPPYKDNLPEKFIRHAIKLFEDSGTDGTVAMFLRHDYDAAYKRTELFKSDMFSAKLTVTTRPKFIDDGTNTSGKHNYAWFVWNVTRSPLSSTAKMLYYNRRDVDPNFPAGRRK